MTRSMEEVIPTGVLETHTMKKVVIVRIITLRVARRVRVIMIMTTAIVGLVDRTTSIMVPAEDITVGTVMMIMMEGDIQEGTGAEDKTQMKNPVKLPGFFLAFSD
jgi:hypothetical protein